MGMNTASYPLTVTFENEWPRVGALCRSMAERFSQLKMFRHYAVAELETFLFLEASIKIGAHLLDSGLAKGLHPTLGTVYTSHVSIDFATLSIDLAAAALENRPDLVDGHVSSYLGSKEVIA